MSERVARSKTVTAKYVTLCVLNLGIRQGLSSYPLLPQYCSFVHSIGFVQVCVWDAHILVTSHIFHNIKVESDMSTSYQSICK